MPRWQRIFVIACAGVIGYVLGYVLADFGQWPKLMYFPLEGQWGIRRVPPGPLPMPYLGLVVWGLAAGLVVAAIAALACGRKKKALSDTALRLWGGWSLTAFLFGGLYFTWNLWPF